MKKQGARWTHAGTREGREKEPDQQVHATVNNRHKS